MIDRRATDSGARRPRKSLVVTLLGLLVMAVSGLLSLVSILALTMILAGSYGSQTSDPLGFLTVIVAPPVSFVAGLGLIFRWRLSRYYLLILCAILIGANVAELARGGMSTAIHTTASGVVTTHDVWGGPNYHSVPIIAACTAAIVVLLLPSIRREFHPARVPSPEQPASSPPPLPSAAPREWRVGHRGRDCIYYEEWHAGTWRRIEISGEMLMGRPHHVIYVPGPENWLAYPEWARHRRDEILERIRSEFAAPDYEYYFGGPAATTRPAAPPVTAAAGEVKPGQWLTLVAVIVLMLALAGGMGWLIKGGLERGETFLPLNRPSLQRPVVREQEPATFWLCIGFFSVVGLGAAGFAAWLAREAVLLRGRTPVRR